MSGDPGRSRSSFALRLFAAAMKAAGLDKSAFMSVVRNIVSAPRLRASISNVAPSRARQSTLSGSEFEDSIETSRRSGKFVAISSATCFLKRRSNRFLMSFTL